MTIQSKLKDFKAYNEAKNKLKDEIVSEIESILYNVINDIDYHFEILNDTLIIKFKTTIIDFDVLKKINDKIDLGCHIGVKKNSSYCLRLCYHL